MPAQIRSRLVNLATAAIAAVTCFGCLGPIRVEAYPTMLECTTLPGVVIWPVNASGERFAYYTGLSDSGESESGRVESLDWPGPLPQNLTLPLGSAAVLLDPEPTPHLRTRCRELLDALESNSPGISTSVTVLPERLGTIKDEDELVRAVLRLYSTAQDWRTRKELSGTLSWNPESPGPGWPAPDCIILPAAGEPAQYFVVGDGTRSVPGERTLELPVHRLTQEQLTEHLLRIDADWIHIGVPSDAPVESRVALSTAFHTLTAPRSDGSFPNVTMRLGKPGAEGLLDAATVRAYLDEQNTDSSE